MSMFATLYSQFIAFSEDDTTVDIILSKVDEVPGGIFISALILGSPNGLSTIIVLTTKFRIRHFAITCRSSSIETSRVS